VSVDTDFEFAIKRVEDFGCRTSVLGVFADVPERLRNACDQTMQVKRKEMIRQNLATEAPEGHPAT